MPIAPLFLAALAGTFTVDDDGPADFADLPAAVAAVQAGDVLLVEPGSYTAFSLDKELVLLGPPGGPLPRVAGISTVQGTPGFAIRGLHFELLRLEQVSGRGLLDGCRLGDFPGPPGPPLGPALFAQDCAQLEVSRCVLIGPDSPTGFGQLGARVLGSTAAFTHCVLRGGTSSGVGLNGGDGLVVAAASTALVQGCSAKGGAGGPSFLGSTDAGGYGLVVVGSTMDLRGSSSDTFEGGTDDFGQVAGVRVSFSGELLWSGVSIVQGIEVLGATATEVDPVEPYLRVDGQDGPGNLRRAKVYGTAGNPALLVAAAGPALAPWTPAGGSTELIWIDLGALLQVFPLVLQGQDTPSAVDFPVPALPGLEGAVLRLQAVVLELPLGGLALTGPGNVIAG